MGKSLEAFALKVASGRICFCTRLRAREGSDASQKLDGKGLPESERENFNHAVFALAFYSRRQDRELLGAISRGLLDCPRRV